MGKDYMTVKGITVRNKGSVYCNWPGDEEGIFYLKDKETGFLIRQVIPQDLELVKRYRRVAAKAILISQYQENGTKKIVTLDKVMKEERDKEVLEKINKSIPKNNPNGDISLIVFNMKTKEFIAIIDVVQVGYTENAIIGFTFSTNELVKRRYESKLKNRIKDLLIEKQICKTLTEEIWSKQKAIYEYVPM